MARNACYAAQQVLHDRDREARGLTGCPRAMTSKQEKEAQGRSQTYWCKSGQDLWKLKSQQPHLFARHGTPAELSKPNLPAGFEATSQPGWLYNAERQVFLEEASQRMLWFDKAGGVYRELAQGQDMTSSLSMSSGASACAVPSSASLARHVVIMDLHKAAEALKLDLGHFDRPAAMLAVYGHGTGSVQPEVAARALHEKLLKRLCGFQEYWSDEVLEAGIVDAFSSVVCDPVEDGGAAAAVALVLGARLVVAAAHGAACQLAELAEGGSVSSSRTIRADKAGSCAVTCTSLEGSGCKGIFLLTEAIRDEAVATSAVHVAKGRCRAGAVALLQATAASAADRPAVSRASACARLLWNGLDRDAGPQAKKRKVDLPADAKVRCRQILLKYVGCKHATDPVRRKPVRRSQADAEAALLSILSEIDVGGDPAFAKHCRAVSECSSSLKGGDLVGDVGWLTRPVEKPGEKPTREAASRQAVVKAAFGLEVGELSDILVSDDGVHILQRRA